MVNFFHRKSNIYKDNKWNKITIKENVIEYKINSIELEDSYICANFSIKCDNLGLNIYDNIALYDLSNIKEKIKEYTDELKRLLIAKIVYNVERKYKEIENMNNVRDITKELSSISNNDIVASVL